VGKLFEVRKMGRLLELDRMCRSRRITRIRGAIRIDQQQLDHAFSGGRAVLDPTRDNEELARAKCHDMISKGHFKFALQDQE
jgi:hypothetical protein